jgi:DNA (cytosine-5)-methyltransferase 1
MTHLDLFSGIGGFALACRMVGGIETVGFCERDNYCQRVLAKHWPDVPICNDIHEMKGNKYGPIDLITGGFPCQPYSVAGERRGNEDDRALWPQMLRVISEARPAWVLGENVPGIITLALDGVLADLEGEGYACETLCIPACGVDAKHRRERIWIVAHTNRGRCEQRQPETESFRGTGGSSEQVILADSDSVRVEGARAEQQAARACGSGEALADTSGGQIDQREFRDVAEASGCGQGGNAAANAGGQDVANAFGKRGCCGNTEGEHAGNAWESSGGAGHDSRGVAQWLAEPNVGRVAHGIPSRVDRLRGLGNAIVPQVAAEIIRCIKEIERQSK